MQIILPTNFTKTHQWAITKYLQDSRQLSNSNWKHLRHGIDLLASAHFIKDNQRFRFDQIYTTVVDLPFADEFIRHLTKVFSNPKQKAQLIAKYAQQIQPALQTAGFYPPNLPAKWLLWAYCLYWWQSFCQGYAFELEIQQDLRMSQIEFKMHNIRDRAGRLTPSDLIVLGLRGDIKTSPYFLQGTSRGNLSSDFYITRLYAPKQAHTLVVMQKPLAWARIGGGQTISSRLDTIFQLLPQAIQLIDRNVNLIIIDYQQWKERVHQEQGVSS